MLVDGNRSIKIQLVKGYMILIISECFIVTYLDRCLMNSGMMMCGNFCVCGARGQIQDPAHVSCSLKMIIFNI